MKDSKPKAGAECKVCLALHDDEIHDATLRVKKWFRHHVTRSFVDDSDRSAQGEPLAAPIATKVA